MLDKAYFYVIIISVSDLFETVPASDNVTVIRLSIKELDMYNIPIFNDDMKPHIGESKPHIIFDMQNIHYMDSSALGAFFNIKKKTDENGQKMFLTSLNKATAMLFRLSRADELLTFYDNVDAALKHI